MTPLPSDSKQVFLITRHGALVIELAKNRNLTVEQLAGRLTVSTRTVRRLITDLEHVGVLRRVREGNRNRYVFNPDVTTADAALGVTVGAFVSRLTM